MLTNIDKFMAVYSAALKKRREEHPLEYGWPQEKLPEVLERVRRSVISGEFIKDDPTVKATCKALRIGNTYKAINSYILQTDVV